MFETVLQKLEPFAREFTRRGKHVYLVGGAVRNLILGRPVQDFDFTTDALPTEVQGYFKKVLPTGLQHGTVTVLFQGASYEVTTFRLDGEYSDGRRPDAVRFTPSLEEDLKRRDFTINSLALDLSDGRLYDPHDGRGDLERRVLRAIGDPGRRFDEDALRLLRLFRFSSQLDFAVAPETAAAVPPRRSRLASVSRERIREELVKALAGTSPERAWGPLADLGFLGDLFPQVRPTPLSSSALGRLRHLSVDVRWPFWMTLACGPDRNAWERALKSLTFSNADQAAILGPPKALEFLAGLPSVPVAAKGILEAWGSRDRLLVGVEYLEALGAEGYWVDDHGLVGELRRAAGSGEPIFLGDLALGGRDLMALGIPGGPKLGQILKDLQKVVWADPGQNTAERLRSQVESHR